MLDRLRFQEIARAIFKVREGCCYGGRRYDKGEPFLVIDNASMSKFDILENSKPVIGRSTEANTTNIEGVSFNLTNGQILLNLFNSIHGETRRGIASTGTIIDTAVLRDSNVLELPSKPVGNVILYTTDDYGESTKMGKDKIASIEDNKITLAEAITGNITYVYEEETLVDTQASIRQLGQELILSLELQCSAMDILTEEHYNVLIKFPKVVVGTELEINFNNSSQASGSIIYVQALPEDLQSRVNKKIFNIEILSN